MPGLKVPAYPKADYFSSVRYVLIQQRRIRPYSAAPDTSLFSSARYVLIQQRQIRPYSAAPDTSLVDVELLRVKGRVALDEDGLAHHLFHLLQPFCAGRLQLFDHLGMDAQHDVAAFEMLMHLAHLDVDVVADGDRRLDHTGALADGAGGGEGAFERLLDPLAGDGDQAKVIELEHLGGRAIGLQLVFERGHHTVAVAALIHVDEVDDDDAAEVAQTDLANDLGDGIEVGLDDGVFQARGLADEFSGVDVDGDQGLGLVDDDGAAGLEPYLGTQGLVDLLGDAELLKQGRLLEVELDAADERGLEALKKAQDALVGILGVDPDGGEGVGDLVAQDAFDEVEVVIDQGGRLGRVRARLDVGPEVEEEAEVAAQLLFAGALGGGAHDEAAGSLAFFAEQDFLQAAAFGVGLDFARDAGVVDRGHEDQEAAGERDVRGDAGALLGDGLLGDLDQNLLPGLEQIADDGQIGGLHGHAAAAVTMATAATAAAIAVAALATPAIAPPAAAFRITAEVAVGIAGRGGCAG